MLIKIQPDATVSRYLFTAKSLYMFWVSQHPSSGVVKTVTAASGTGHNTGTATSLQCGLIRSRKGAHLNMLEGFHIHTEAATNNHLNPHRSCHKQPLE